VVAGADINSEVSTDGKTSSYFVEKVFGRIPIFPCNEAVYNQRLRVDTLGSLFKTVSGHRRITIAKDFISLDRNSRRGVIEMIKQDVWLEPEKRRPGDYVPKNREILVQHIRDALMMGGVMLMAPPTWGLDRIEAA
jgi:hypothetical protein